MFLEKFSEISMHTVVVVVTNKNPPRLTIGGCSARSGTCKILGPYTVAVSGEKHGRNPTDTDERQASDRVADKNNEIFF